MEKVSSKNKSNKAVAKSTRAVLAINQGQNKIRKVEYCSKKYIVEQDPRTADTELVQEHIARLKGNGLYCALLQIQHVED
ncbi:hypothetical protein F443_15026 [Phytophthora nicotianae P1569]|uniref:Uncharacterized protein n=1 Tax=Phytophthora nicotianae P1569 TaxID=1317065 RepID=V9ELN2_PHYNI|nr:hypothetical protein F443_15026 [Phytophthora nicotianae P1569]